MRQLQIADEFGPGPHSRSRAASHWQEPRSTADGCERQQCLLAKFRREGVVSTRGSPTPCPRRPRPRLRLGLRLPNLLCQHFAPGPRHGGKGRWTHYSRSARAVLALRLLRGRRGFRLRLLLNLVAVKGGSGQCISQTDLLSLYI